MHTSSTECRGGRPGIRRSHEIGIEIAISRHDHSHSHLTIHIHTSSAECRGGRPGIRRSHEIGPRLQSRGMIIHIHTSFRIPGRSPPHSEKLPFLEVGEPGRLPFGRVRCARLHRVANPVVRLMHAWGVYTCHNRKHRRNSVGAL